MGVQMGQGRRRRATDRRSGCENARIYERNFLQTERRGARLGGQSQMTGRDVGARKIEPVTSGGGASGSGNPRGICTWMPFHQDIELSAGCATLLPWSRSSTKMRSKKSKKKLTLVPHFATVTPHTELTQHKHMRTKALLLTAALGLASVATSMAQAVYSVNVVGYINLTMKPGFNLVANQERFSEQ